MSDVVWMYSQQSCSAEHFECSCSMTFFFFMPSTRVIIADIYRWRTKNVNDCVSKMCRHSYPCPRPVFRHAACNKVLTTKIKIFIFNWSLWQTIPLQNKYNLSIFLYCSDMNFVLLSHQLHHIIFLFSHKSTCPLRTVNFIW